MKRRKPLFVVLGVAAVVPVVVSCTHTIEGTGSPGAGTGTSTTSAPVPGLCPNLTGSWDVRGGGICGQDHCRITQTGCALVLECNASTLDGTVSGPSVEWHGDNGGSCSGTIIGPAAARVDATCTAPDGQCSLVATKL